MQRQSLGSPGPKLQVAGGGDAVATAEREERRKSAAAVAALVVSAASEEAEIKTEKPLRGPSPDRSIHFIPVLTLLCILLLYLMSHDPTAHALKPTTTSAIGRHAGEESLGAGGGSGGAMSAVGGRRGLKASTADAKLRRRKLGTR